jgi:hypothetical protein
MLLLMFRGTEVERTAGVPIPKFAQACGFIRKNFKSAALVWFSSEVRWKDSQEKSGELLNHHTRSVQKTPS